VIARRGVAMDAISLILDDGEIWLQYATRINILGEKEEDLTDLRQQCFQIPKTLHILAM